MAYCTSYHYSVHGYFDSIILYMYICITHIYIYIFGNANALDTKLVWQTLSFFFSFLCCGKQHHVNDKLEQFENIKMVRNLRLFTGKAAKLQAFNSCIYLMHFLILSALLHSDQWYDTGSLFTFSLICETTFRHS